MAETSFETEETAQGRQSLVPGVRPVALRDRLAVLMDAPLVPRKPQKPPNIGLFDEDRRNQLDLFLHGGAGKR